VFLIKNLMQLPEVDQWELEERGVGDGQRAVQGNGGSDDAVVGTAPTQSWITKSHSQI